jgi:hypothetical protein
VELDFEAEDLAAADEMLDEGDTAEN